MKKEERQAQLLRILNQSGSVSVSQIMEALSVSDMTVRRDLNELEKAGLLIRTHGGARRIAEGGNSYERTHIEKKSLHEDEKKEIAALAASFVNEGETIFLGPGTTIEMIAEELMNKKIRVVTNSLPVFEILNQSTSVDLILSGGEYRKVTGAFVGTAAICALKNMRFSKAMISVNGIAEQGVYTYSEAEGEIQKFALNSAAEKYLAADSSKFGNYDFYEFYRLSDFDHVITDSKVSEKDLEELKSICEVHIA